MADQPLVRLTILCIDAARFVSDTVPSELARSYAYTEMTVTDDSSAGAGLDVPESFGKDNSQQTGPGRGACGARNRGLERDWRDTMQPVPFGG